MADPDTLVEVISLQDCCLLYLVTHVEDYSPQTLTLLPKHLRRDFLSSVAALHLYQFNMTQVADGIDTESLWRDVDFSKLLSFIPKDRTKMTSQQSFSLFLSQVCCSILSTEPLTGLPIFPNTYDPNQLICIEIALFGLFHNRLSSGMVAYLNRMKGFVNTRHMCCFTTIDTFSKYKSIYCLIHLPVAPLLHHDAVELMGSRFLKCSCDCDHNKPFCPPIKLNLANTLFCAIAKQIVLALVKAGVFPPELEISARKIVNTELWLPGKGGPILPLLDGSKVTHIMIDPEQESPNTTSSVLRAVLSSPNVCLKHLQVTKSIDGNTLASIAPLLATYGGLATLKVIIDTEISKTHFSIPLLHIISKQRALEEVYINRKITVDNYNDHPILDDKVIRCVSSLFQNRSMRSVTVVAFAVSQDAFTEIIAAFLESSPDCDSRLILRNLFVLSGSTSHRRVVVSHEHAKKFGPRKTLSLFSVNFSLDSETFWTWFEAIPYVRLAVLSRDLPYYILSQKQTPEVQGCLQ